MILQKDERGGNDDDFPYCLAEVEWVYCGEGKEYQHTMYGPIAKKILGGEHDGLSVWNVEEEDAPRIVFEREALLKAQQSKGSTGEMYGSDREQWRHQLEIAQVAVNLLSQAEVLPTLGETFPDLVESKGEEQRDDSGEHASALGSKCYSPSWTINVLLALLCILALLFAVTLMTRRKRKKIQT